MALRFAIVDAHTNEHLSYTEAEFVRDLALKLPRLHFKLTKKKSYEFLHKHIDAVLLDFKKRTKKLPPHI